ncbi:MAG: hypothetical protein EA400_11965 [Chromatiaceae bacterium]|nr:MAG: hypothetical protein EA400_11965 [Chromatiaceae bacterium]
MIAPLRFLMALGPLARWRQTDLPTRVQRLRWAFAVGPALALLIPVLAGRAPPPASVCYWDCG